MLEANSWRAGLCGAIGAALLCGCAAAPATTISGALRPRQRGSAFTRDELQTVNVFVSPQLPARSFVKVAVLPFRAPVDLAGAATADALATEILQSYKYQLVERSQMERILGEQALGLKGVTDNEAVQVGRLIGVQGVIVGTISEYGLRAAGSKELPAIGLNVRMIDVADGVIVWSVSYAGVASTPTSISAFGDTVVRLCVARLRQEWTRVGDTAATVFPPPRVLSARGALREASVEIARDNFYSEYRLLRASAAEGPYEKVASVKGSGRSLVLKDCGLADAAVFYYRVTGITPEGLSGQSSPTMELTTAGPPQAVDDFNAVSGRLREVPLSWRPSPAPHLKGYSLSRHRGGTWSTLKTINDPRASSWTDKGLKDGETCRYRIIAVNTAGLESPPALAEATTKSLPRPVAGLRAERSGVDAVSISWEANPEPGIVRYEVFRGEKEEPPTRKLADVPAPDRGFTDRGLGGGRACCYRVRAVDADGLVGEYSLTVSAQTKPLPRRPLGLSAAVEGERVVLTWEAGPERDISHYVVYDTGGSGARVVGETGEPRFSCPARKGEMKFRVQAVDGDGLASEQSAEVAVKVEKR